MSPRPSSTNSAFGALVQEPPNFFRVLNRERGKKKEEEKREEEKEEERDNCGVTVA